MTPESLSIRLTGADVLRDGALQQRSVAIHAGRITKGPLPEVDLSGFYVLPGVIDLHHTGLVSHAQAILSGTLSPRQALRKVTKACLWDGLTTAFLSYGWSWEGGFGMPELTERLVAEHMIHQLNTEMDLKIKILAETHTVPFADRLLALIQRHGVSYVSFANTLAKTEAMLGAPHPFGMAADPSEYALRSKTAAEQNKSVPRYLCRMAENFDDLGVVYGSVEDRDGETRETYSMIGAKLCEFPTRRAAAALARAVSDPVVLPCKAPAPGSSGETIAPHMADALATGPSGGSLVSSAFALSRLPGWDLPRAWALISQAPAQILRLPDRGVIDLGKRADLVLVNAETEAVEGTICEGRASFLSGEAKSRFFGALGEERLAAE